MYKRQYFPDAKSRILALHVNADSLLERLREKLLLAAKSTGLPCDSRAFKPHITLARLRHRQHIHGWQLPSYQKTWQANEFALYASEGKTGVAYQVVQRFPLLG